MAHNTLEIAVEASNVRIKFPKITLAALSVPFVLLVSLTFAPEGEPTPATVAPLATEQPELAVEAAPVATVEPKRAEPVEPDNVFTDNAEPVVQPIAPAIAPDSPVSAGYISGSCQDLNKMGLGNFQSGDPNYSSRRDRDRDGWACEF